MSLKLILTPLDHRQWSDINDPYAVINHTALYEENLPDIDSADMVIVGVPDSRGTLSQYDTEEALTRIRRNFYKLKSSYFNFRLADLGNITPGPTLQDTYERLTLVQKTVHEAGKILIILGATHDLTLGQYLGSAGPSRRVMVATVDRQLDLYSNNDLGNNTFFMAKILAKFGDNLLKWIPIGHQTHLVQNNHLKLIESMSFPAMRLGALKENILLAEPYIRNADILSIDMQALAWPFNTLNHLPFGLTADELVQLAWFAGFSEKCQSIGFYELNSPENQEAFAAIVATAMWYFIEARYHAGLAGGPYFQNFKKLVVEHEAFPYAITFLHNPVHDKYWIEHQLNDETLYIACNAQDYHNALQGIEPEILFYFHA